LKYGISREDFLADYVRVRGKNYDVLKHIEDIFKKRSLKIEEKEVKSIVDTLFIDITVLLNREIFTFISKHTNNVTVLSAGNYDFQMRKIIETGVKDVVSEVVIVPQSKKEWVIAFTEKYPHEMIYFIDDTLEHIRHPEFSDIPNLKTILYSNVESLRELM
jgi:hypothetical protein